jgi:AraC-like DNA-binding protein
MSMIVSPNNSIVNIFIEITAISLQTILFSFALINLFDNSFVNKIYVWKHLSPTALFILFMFVFVWGWGNPTLQNTDDFIHNFTHPTVILNMLFLLFCIAQVIYFTRLFLSQEKEYVLKLANYYADTFQLRLSWVRYCFFGACVFCILIIVSMFITSPSFELVVIVINIIFYVVFGLCYIQYPLTYTSIEPILNSRQPVSSKEPEVIFNNFSWEKLKSIIIAEKYYLRPELNIEEMALYLKVGRTKLSNCINKEGGMNFHAWINSLRIEEAKRLIQTNPNLSFAQIAEMVGYSEQSNFSRQFKQIVNQAPTIWKHEQLSKNAQINNTRSNLNT